jgi:hypothetical protein
MGDPEEDEEWSACCVCLAAPATQCLLACGHTALCGACFKLLLSRSDARCPVCRALNVAGAHGALELAPVASAPTSSADASATFVPPLERLRLVTTHLAAARSSLHVCAWEAALCGLAAFAAGSKATHALAVSHDAVQLALATLRSPAPDAAVTAAGFLLSMLLSSPAGTDVALPDDTARALLAALRRLQRRGTAASDCVAHVVRALSVVCAMHARDATFAMSRRGNALALLARLAAPGTSHACIAAVVSAMATLVEQAGSSGCRVDARDAVACTAVVVAAAGARGDESQDAGKLFTCTRVLFALCRQGHERSVRAAGGLHVMIDALAQRVHGDCGCASCLHAAALAVRTIHMLVLADAGDAAGDAAADDMQYAAVTLVGAVDTFGTDRHTVWRACRALLTILDAASGDGNAAIRAAIAAHSGLQVALDAAEEHADDEYVAAHALSLAAALTRGDARNADAVVQLGFTRLAASAIMSRCGARTSATLHRGSACMLLVRACVSLLGAAVCCSTQQHADEDGVAVVCALSAGLLHLCGAPASREVDSAQAAASEGLLHISLASPRSLRAVAAAGGLHALVAALALDCCADKPHSKRAGAAALAIIVASLCACEGWAEPCELRAPAAKKRRTHEALATAVL